MSDVPLYTQEQRIAALEAALLAEREKAKRLETIAKIAAEMRTNTLRADGSIMWLNKAADLGAQMDAALAEAGEE